jgi:hypothetical protein
MADAYENRDAPWCSSPRDCVVKRRADIAKLIDLSDARDKKFNTAEGSFDAAELFKALPGDPDPPGLLETFFPPHIPILPYEALLAHFRHIERTIDAKRARRKEAAQDLINSAIADQQRAIKLYESANANCHNSTDALQDTKDTIDRCASVLADLPKTLATAKKALELESDLQNEFLKLNSEVNDFVKRASKLKSEAESSPSGKLEKAFKFK